MNQQLVRVGVVLALGRSGNALAEPSLIAALNDSHPMVRSMAENALKEFNTPRAHRALDDYNHTKPSGNKASISSLDQMSGYDSLNLISKSLLDRPRVFLSYPKEDAEQIEEIRRLLKMAGFDPWIDSKSLIAGEDWDSQLRRAIKTSDFVVGFLSRHTLGGYQEQELKVAFEDAPNRNEGKSSFVLPCIIDGLLYQDFDHTIPAFLKETHAINLTNIEEGWKDLHKSLCQASRSAGLTVPSFFRSKPRYDFTLSNAIGMIIENNFYEFQYNNTGRRAELSLRLLAGGMLVEDRITGRIWTRGCISESELPSTPLPTLDDELAMLTPERYKEAEDKSEYSVIRMRDTINEWRARLDKEQLCGYTGWRLPTLEEAMSLMTKNVRGGGLHISELFTDHKYVRTSDENFHPFGIQGQSTNGYKTVWAVSYGTGEIIEVAAQARVALRFVRMD